MSQFIWNGLSFVLLYFTPSILVVKKKDLGINSVTVLLLVS